MGIVLAVLAIGGGTAGAVVSGGTGVIGPSNRIQPTGRQLHPVGRLVTLGNFPTGAALTPDGRYLWTVSAGRGVNDIRIVSVRGRRVIQTILMPGLDGGISISPDGRTGYVSGIPMSSFTDLKVPASIPGRGGDVISVFRIDRKHGTASRNGVIAVPAPPGAPAEQAFPPTTTKSSWPWGLAVSPNGKTLVAALNLADYAAVVNTRNRKVRYVRVGHYPYGAAVTTDGRYGLVTSETQGTVSVIKLSSAKVVKTVTVGPHLSNAEGIAIDPKAPLAFVANTNDDTITVLNTKRLRAQGILSLLRSQGNGTTPTQLSVTGDGCDLLVSDSGEDAVAVFALSTSHGCNPGAKGKRRTKVLDLVGRLPVGSYPTFVAAPSVHGLLTWVSARGLDVGANLRGPVPTSPNDTNNFEDSFQYLPSIVRGDAGILSFPSDARIRSLTPVADRELTPTDAQSAPAGTPIAPNGPIKHVFFIVKENRTYDQVFGDIARGDGDPALTLFGQNITPNEHALVTRFPLLDHVYADSEVSIDGHYFTAAGAVPDYAIRSWPPNYAGRGRPLDFGAYEVSSPPQGFIFQRAFAAGIPFYNYGEAFAGIGYILNDKDRTAAELANEHAIAGGSDVQLIGGGPAYPGGPSLAPCYDSDATIFNPIGQPNVDVFDSSLPAGAPAGSHSRYECWLNRFEGQLAHNAVPAINYLSLPLDHTEGVAPGDRTPDADVADNDWALGQIVDTISHSSIWNSSLILVLEDDAQDGADHVDAHRIPALVISPYAKGGGAVIANRYDQLSFLRTLEIIVGMKPASLGEDLAVPLYDAFSSSPSNSSPYTAITPNVSVTQTNPNTAADRRAADGLNLSALDQVPEQQLDAMLWHYVHGFGSAPPPPGPNASAQSPAAEDAPLAHTVQPYFLALLKSYFSARSKRP